MKNSIFLQELFQKENPVASTLERRAESIYKIGRTACDLFARPEVFQLQTQKGNDISVLFCSRTDAGDHLRLLEDGVARKHREHSDGDQPRGSGEGE